MEQREQNFRHHSHKRLRFFAGYAAKKWRLRRSGFFQGAGKPPNIDNEFRAKHT
jgi:hypothetical protein